MDVAQDAAVTLVESVVFGRLAMGEIVESGLFADRWRVRRAARLIFADELSFDGAIAEQLNRPASPAAARCATLLTAPDAEGKLAMRAALETRSASEVGVAPGTGLRGAPRAPSPERSVPLWSRLWQTCGARRAARLELTSRGAAHEPHAA